MLLILKAVKLMFAVNDASRDLTDKPNRNQNGIESESGEESKGEGRH